MPGSTKGACPTRTFRYSKSFINLTGGPTKFPHHTGRSILPAHLTAEDLPYLSKYSSAVFPGRALQRTLR